MCLWILEDQEQNEKELCYYLICKGLHAYTNLEEAKYWKEEDEPIIKFKVKAENIVAVENGCSKQKHNFQRLVYTKLEFVEIIRED
jgi:hypothetical protein